MARTRHVALWRRAGPPAPGDAVREAV